VGGSVGTAGRRLALPCAAPLPTGFCLQSDAGDYIGGGRSSSANGTASVTLQSSGGTNLLAFNLTESAAGNQWTAEFTPANGVVLAPGLFDPAQRYPFQVGSAAGLSIFGNGRGCNML